MNYVSLLITNKSLSVFFSIAEATAVVQVEDTKLILKSLDDAEEEEIEIMTEPKEGQDIRYKVV